GGSGERRVRSLRAARRAASKPRAVGRGVSAQVRAPTGIIVSARLPVGSLARARRAHTRHRRDSGSGGAARALVPAPETPGAAPALADPRRQSPVPAPADHVRAQRRRGLGTRRTGAARPQAGATGVGPWTASDREHAPGELRASGSGAIRCGTGRT